MKGKSDYAPVARRGTVRAVPMVGQGMGMIGYDAVAVMIMHTNELKMDS